MKDAQIVELIRAGDNRKALEMVYLHFPKVRNMILQKGGSKTEAKDIFQESIIIFYDNAVKDDFELTSAISTYLYGISYNLWLKRIRKVKNREVVLESTYDSSEELPELELVQTEVLQKSFLKKLMKAVGKKCEQVLLKYYYQQMSMQEIASDMGYSSHKTAKNHKYRCLQKAREIALTEHSERKEVLL